MYLSTLTRLFNFLDKENLLKVHYFINCKCSVFPSQIDDLSREVGKLKDALNSLSQLSYSSGSPSKRLQQNQQLETMQQQIKQLQYQLAVRFI